MLLDQPWPPDLYPVRVPFRRRTLTVMEPFYFRHTLTQGVADSQFTWTGAGSSWLPVAGDFGLD